MKILGIETSCDETGAAIVEDGTKILSNVVASSQELHIKTGGIIPEVAAREQIKCILPVIKEALIQADSEKRLADRKFLSPSPYPLAPNIDAIAVTIGPGLIGSLLVGVETGKSLAFLWHKPIIPVNHLLAHVYANWIDNNSTRQQFNNKFPSIALIVSGGHTEVILMKSHSKYVYLGGTRDDAAGECFDKCARILGLGYPGGPAVEVAAAKFKIQSAQGGSKFKIKLPRPMIDSTDFDFSFSGLKTAVLREVQKLKSRQQLSNLTIQQLADEAQEAITDVLVEKTLRAAEKYKVKSILLAGGVAANSRLREKISLKIENCKLKIRLHLPPPSLCTDNAAVIASCAYFNFKPIPWQKIQALPSLTL